MNSQKIKEKTKLVKTHTREHTLFYGYVWYESDYKYIAELWSHTLNNFVLIKEPKSNKLSAWHDQGELDDIYSWVVKQLNENPKYFNLVKKRFYQYLNPMLPYLKGRKKIKNFKEFKNYYYNWIYWWSPMDSFLLIPDFENVPSKIKEEALKIRKDTQEYTEYLDVVFKDFFLFNYPKHKDLVNEIIPEELFLLEKRSFSREKIREIKERKNGCAIFRDKVFLLGDLEKELEKKHFYLEKIRAGNVKELKGMNAYPGKVTAKVRIIWKKEEIPKLKKGEIIVSEMTSPEFLPGIKRAAAIITDEGGITCHAAIVAREIKRPCIVGTKIATKVLKDGDLVEVDANNGIVKIIK